mmetsp:Transcript_105063/g.285281  ORF Transcript_105063/g.285281 Transcript_105063/m.285281 type:complete len:207 (-) Transcript_105063:13-633(-)
MQRRSQCLLPSWGPLLLARIHQAALLVDASRTRHRAPPDPRLAQGEQGRHDHHGTRAHLPESHHRLGNRCGTTGLGGSCLGELPHGRAETGWHVRVRLVLQPLRQLQGPGIRGGLLDVLWALRVRDAQPATGDVEDKVLVEHKRDADDGLKYRIRHEGATPKCLVGALLQVSLWHPIDSHVALEVKCQWWKTNRSCVHVPETPTAV